MDTEEEDGIKNRMKMSVSRSNERIVPVVPRDITWFQPRYPSG
jgi:hypothetical protein